MRCEARARATGLAVATSLPAESSDELAGARPEDRLGQGTGGLDRVDQPGVLSHQQRSVFGVPRRACDLKPRQHLLALPAKLAFAAEPLLYERIPFDARVGARPDLARDDVGDIGQ